MPGESCLLPEADSLVQGVRAVVTLNEDFEVFISSEQYKVSDSLLPAAKLCSLLHS